MRSIGSRLAVWYALAGTATLACLFLAGHYLLRDYLIRGLDLLIASEFEQVKAHIGKDYRELSAADIDRRIRETTEYASVLFYIDIHSAQGGTIFYSSNLTGRSIPDIKGKRQYDVEWDGGSRLRVGEFILAPYDVIIATPERQVEDVMTGYAKVSAALLALMLAVSLGIGFGLSRLALRPVRLIRATASRIGSNNLSERIPVSQVQDEISDLARLLNAMFDRLEASLTNARRFAADASHELKTPLSLIRLNAERLLSGGTLATEQEEALQSLLEEVNRVNATIDELLFLSRAESRSITLELSAHDPAALLANFNVDAQVLAEHHGVRFDYRHQGTGSAVVEPRWIRRLLLNLLVNAIHVAPKGSEIRVTSSLQHGRWRVALEDEGPGVPASELDRIFERFVRINPPSEAAREGTGLGLAICRGIIELHKGWISAEPGSGGRGLRVVFETPAVPDPVPDRLP
jgi:two-component system heavy metal sensor histidine kinase CusS